MPAKDLGTKHTCFKCGTKFYDMKKPDPICPKCGEDQRNQPKPAAEPRRGRLAATPKVIEPEPEEAAASEEDEENLDSFGDDEEAEATTEAEDDDI